MKRMACLLLLIVSMAWITDAMAANTYYVAGNGNDGNSCAMAKNSNTPKATIASNGPISGVDCLGPGDTLIVMGAPSSEPSTRKQSPWAGFQGRRQRALA